MPGVTIGQTVTLTVNVMQPPLYTDTWYSLGTMMTGVVSAYAAGNITVNVSSVNPTYAGSSWYAPQWTWIITPVSNGYINTFTGTGTYPSNADVWWYFKNTSGVFDPLTTIGNVTLASGRAPQGHYILGAFNQARSSVSGTTVTDTNTYLRPTTGAWFQGRVWYTGVQASQGSSGTANYYTWTENIYFSQVVERVEQVGYAYQLNDPTSENLNGILPTDGGVITIPGTGQVFKLWPIQNGMLVFAANGVWFITGSQGIGFAANDYTITKISSIKSISSTSFVDVQGLPFFWNEDGIYQVTPQQGGGLSVESISVGTIQTFFNNIPPSSRRYVRGDYNPIDYVIQWVYRSTPETDATDRYECDRILCYNTYNKAFYPYTISVGPVSQYIHDVKYINYPVVGTDTPDPIFKYLYTQVDVGDEHSLAEELDYTTFYDWLSADFDSYFTAGYVVRGDAIRKFQSQYVEVFNRTMGEEGGYKIQGIWDYSNNRNSGRWSTAEYVTYPGENYDVVFRRHKIRGHGLALQFKVENIPNKPFSVIGWATSSTINAGV